jgi:hypothetical protein
MPDPKGARGVRKIVPAVGAAVLAYALTYAIWKIVGEVLSPPAFVRLVGWFVTFALLTARLYTWAVDGPVRWRTKAVRRGS